jgi:DNA-binding CsgD family transcriptional regulator
MRKEILELRKKGYSYKQIQKELQCSAGAITYHLRKAGLIPARSTKLSNNQIKKIEVLRRQGVSTLEISKQFGISQTTVIKFIPEELKALRIENKLPKEVSKYRRRKSAIVRRETFYRDLFKTLGKSACERCGYDKNIAALEFHHEDPNEKDFLISGKFYNLEKAVKEAEKCLLLCANCHREEHIKIREDRYKKEEQYIKEKYGQKYIL